MDAETKGRAHLKLSSIKEYIAYPPEIMVNKNLEELYDGLLISRDEYFKNGINMSIWSTNYHWRKLREKMDKTDWKRHANPAVVNAFYSSIENSIQFPAGILQVLTRSTFSIIVVQNIVKNANRNKVADRK
jgi:membrane metallo-endopeptidase-like protein 1